MIFCPNKNSKEFKELVSSVGENRAYFLWNKYEGNVPKYVYSNIKSGIDFVFQQSPELSKIGTQEQYSQYLDTIFPDNDLNNILVHYSSNKFDKFIHTTDFGYHFANPEEVDNEFLSQIAGYKNTDINNLAPIYVKLNFNPLEISNQRTWTTENIIKDMFSRGYIDTENAKNIILDKLEKSNNKFKTLTTILKSFGVNGFYYFNESEGGWAYSVFEPEQIHLLGGKNDINGFKDFMSFDNSEFSKYGTYQQFRDFITSKFSIEIENRLIETGKINRVC